MTNPSNYTEKLKEHFSPLLATHGQSFKSVDWGSREGQLLRFSVLSQVFLGKSNSTEATQARLDSVLDVGCGLGDYLDYLEQHHFSLDYCGIDILPEMIAEAKRRRPHSNFSCYDIFKEKKLPETFDYTIASGIFFCGDENLMKEAIAILFEKTKVALAFNSLSDWALDKDSSEFFACPLKTLDYCRSLTPWVQLRHDYMPNDFTIFMHREKNS